MDCGAVTTGTDAEPGPRLIPASSASASGCGLTSKSSAGIAAVASESSWEEPTSCRVSRLCAANVDGSVRISRARISGLAHGRVSLVHRFFRSSS